jgi:hypothetical protein
MLPTPKFYLKNLIILNVNRASSLKAPEKFQEIQQTRAPKSSDGKIQRYKARLVAQGFSQTQGIDYHETFSPVVRYESVKMLLAHAIHHDMVVRQIDIKTAFLNGDIDCEVYMAIPEGIMANQGEVCRLKKSIYGLKQSPRRWNTKLVDTLKRRGLVQSTADPCVFFQPDGTEIVEFYVDDLISASKDDDLANDLERFLQTQFKVTLAGTPRYLLTMQMD